MTFEKKLYRYKESMKMIPDEIGIQETVKNSINAFCLSEQERLLSYWEFLWAQIGIIRKRWWLFQLMLLFALWLMLPSIDGELCVERTLGVMASLFVILIIPELWKNRTYQSMEIEATSYYSLRQIYSARMLLFGVVDVVLITLFCSFTFVAWGITLSQLLIHFLFPMVVTSCICFGFLCSKYSFSEAFAVLLCVGWSGVWWFIIMNESVYAAIIMPVWFGLLGIAIAFLMITAFRTVHYCNNYWEVKANGISIR